MKGIQAAKLCGSPIISVVRKERNSATLTNLRQILGGQTYIVHKSDRKNKVRDECDIQLGCGVPSKCGN